MKKVIRNVEGISPEIHRWGKIWELVTESDGGPGSAALLEMTSPNDPQHTKKATRYYFILEGRGEIGFPPDGAQSVKPGSSICIPPQKIHHLIPATQEKLKVLVFSIPPYSDADTVYQSSL